MGKFLFYLFSIFIGCTVGLFILAGIMIIFTSIAGPHYSLFADSRILFIIVLLILTVYGYPLIIRFMKRHKRQLGNKQFMYFFVGLVVAVLLVNLSSLTQLILRLLLIR